MFAPASIPTPGHTHDTKLGQSLLCGGDQADKAGWNSQIVCIIVQHFLKFYNNILVFDVSNFLSLVKFGQGMTRSTGKKPNH